MKIVGVFDSGIGGQSVADAITTALPDINVIFVNDTKNVPYGNKQPAELLKLTVPIFEDMVRQGCNVIVVACNTITTTIISELRERIHVPLVAVEPMVKPASQLTSSKIITVCATPTTLASPRYQELKNTYAANITVLEPDCSDWSSLIEQNKVNEIEIARDIMPGIEQGSDVVVLGCTHYHWIEQEIKELVGEKAVVLQPELALVSQLKRVLAQLA